MAVRLSRKEETRVRFSVRAPYQVVAKYFTMLISEIFDHTQHTFQAWADQIKVQFGLHAFDLWLDRSGDIKLNSLIVPTKDQKTGLGTATMLALCRMADQMGKRIVLSPATRDDKWGTTSQKRLISFYKRFGFVQNKGRKKDFALSDGMFRDPRTA